MRIAVEMARVQSHEAEQFDDHLAAIIGVAHRVNDQRFAEDVEYGHSWVERAERVLEDVLDPPAERHQLAIIEAEQVDPPAVVVVIHMAGVGIDGAHDHLAHRRLAAAAFAHQSQAARRVRPGN